jgi:hypothetical protein
MRKALVTERELETWKHLVYRIKSFRPGESKFVSLADTHFNDFRDCVRMASNGDIEAQALLAEFEEVLASDWYEINEVTKKLLQ